VLDVRRLKILRELKIRGTLAGVALALNQSPSSISQQLAQLEREVGVELIRKAGRRVQLTPQAEILAAHAGAVMERLELAEAEVAASLSTVTGRARIASFQSAANALIPPMLTVLNTVYPGLEIEMVQREPEAAEYELWARDFDIVIAQQLPWQTAQHHPELDWVPLATDAIRLTVPPDSAGGRRFTRIQDAQDFPWVMEPRGMSTRHWVEQTCRQAGFEPNVRFEVSDLQAAVSLIESGHAVGMLPDLFWAHREVPVRLIELPGRPRRQIFTAARKASAQSPVIRAVREVLVKVAEDLRPLTG
jgi:DNA-binding transcriptional LysR family regulator